MLNDQQDVQQNITLQFKISVGLTKTWHVSKGHKDLRAFKMTT